jgi:hypothetical protein
VPVINDTADICLRQELIVMNEYNTLTLAPASGPGIAIGGGMCPGGGMPQPGIPQPQPGPHAGGPGAMEASNCGCA